LSSGIIVYEGRIWINSDLWSKKSKKSKKKENDFYKRFFFSIKLKQKGIPDESQIKKEAEKNICIKAKKKK
jgi:hypothetical protein